MLFDFFKRKKASSAKSSASKNLEKTPQIPIVFMGTPELSREVLEAILTAGYRVVGVVTQPDKPVGRKRELTSSPVKTLALEKNIPLLQPEKWDEAALHTLSQWKPDLVLVAAYGKILPETVLKIPGLGSLNVHASLLPRWRGASPIQNALMAGDAVTGITLMLMDKGMDTGDIIAQKEVVIEPEETAGTLTERLTKEGADFLVETLPKFIRREITPQAQTTDGVTLCQLIEREDGHIFWNTPAEEIYNHYRGLSPWPGVFTYWKKGDDLLRLKILHMSLQKTNPMQVSPEGTVFETGEKVGVQTGLGVIFLETIQLEGKEPVNTKDFLNGNPDFLGAQLS